MFYKNLKHKKETFQKDLVFSIFDDGLVSNVDDSLTSGNECKSVYNLSISDGALKTGLGFKIFETPISLEHLDQTRTYDFSQLVEIRKILFDKVYDSEAEEFFYRLHLVDSSNRVWSILFLDEDGSIIYPDSSRLTAEPTFCCLYREGSSDSALFFSKYGMLMLSYPGEYLLTNVPELMSFAVHYGKFFGITKKDHKLVYTSNLSFSNWDDDDNSVIEFLDNRGLFNKLVAFKDYVYLFRENGITRISIYSANGEFSFTHLYSSSSKIYENSVCVCGEKIFFVTRDGLYSFDGTNVNKILKNYDNYFKSLDNTNCTCASLNGKYYLATKLDFSDGDEVGCEDDSFVNNVVFEIDVETLDVNVLRGVDVRMFSAIDCPFLSKLCACFYNENKCVLGELSYDGKVFSDVLKKQWKSFETDLSVQGKRKRLRKLVVRSKYNCTFKIVSDEETKIYQIEGNLNEQILPINCYGKIFQFSFETSSQFCEIRKPKIVFDVEK